jgi:hypothetical protein
MKGAMMEMKKASQDLAGDANPGDQRAMFQPMEILCGVFWPTLMFVYIFRLNLGWWRHRHALETCVVTMIFPILFNLWFSRRMYNALKRGNCRRWKLVMNVILWFVIFYACLHADKAYWRFARSYYDFQSMASYINIDPNSDRGQSYMDAGQVYFKEGTQVEVSKAIAFQEDNIYCVAPIVQQTLDSGGDASASLSGNALKLPKSGTVDFWAVGINCCDPSGLNFKCGESKNPLARAGIRELRDDTRPFFLMAVQEWTAWLQMPSKHPIFFHWVQDPLLQVDNFWFSAMKMFYIGTMNCIMGTLAGTLIFQYIFYNLGV